MTNDNFDTRRKAFQALGKQKGELYNKVSVLRVALFLSFFAAGFWLINTEAYAYAGILILIFPILFGLLIKRHNKIKFERNQFAFLSEINGHEVDRISGKLHSFDAGTEYQNELHPYSNDLDIFGRNSLFQLLSRAVTPSGKQSLANWLLSPAPNSEIIERQKAVRELAGKIDWRQEFQALGLHEYDTKRDAEKLNTWLDEPESENNPNALRIMGILLPTIALIFLVLYLSIGLSIYFLFGMLALNGFILKRFMDKVKEITEETNDNVGLLKSYSRLIGHIERSTFNSILLNDKQQHFASSRFSAAKAILDLQRILDFLNSRANMFYALINLTLLTDIHLVLSTQKWKKENAHHVSKWFKAIGEFEALSSLAAFAYANEAYAYPKLADEHYCYQAKELGHPLIFSEERIVNDFHLNGRGQIAIITGSNMSGKSTFLRTLGVNAVLAFAGAPCCTSEMSISNFQVFTGMRTQDNLEEHVSSFYAELKRIKQLLDMVEKEGKPVFFLLDEILKGTNSKDRHLGSASLVKQLSKENAFGLVSTHDLELGDLAKSMEGVVNYSFNSQIHGDEISFDYKLTDGVCQSFNASKLMKNMGINIKSPGR